MGGVRERLAQLRQDLAQIGVGLGLGRIGPQEKGDMRASLGSSSMQHQVGKQGLQTSDLHRRHRSII